MTSEITKLASAKMATNLIKKNWMLTKMTPRNHVCHDESAQKWIIRVLSC